MASDKVHTITCRGCGQVGTLVTDPREAAEVRRRRHGFYLHGKRDGVQVVACCKCQQIRPYDSDLGGP